MNRWVSCRTIPREWRRASFRYLYVNAVVDNRAALDVVETVDQVRDRRFPAPVEPTKQFSDLVGIQADVL